MNNDESGNPSGWMPNPLSPRANDLQFEMVFIFIHSLFSKLYCLRTVIHISAYIWQNALLSITIIIFLRDNIYIYIYIYQISVVGYGRWFQVSMLERLLPSWKFIYFFFVQLLKFSIIVILLRYSYGKVKSQLSLPRTEATLTPCNDIMSAISSSFFVHKTTPNLKPSHCERKM